MSKITMQQFLDGMLRRNGMKGRGNVLNTYYQNKVVYSINRLVDKIQEKDTERIILNIEDIKNSDEIVKFYFDLVASLFENNNKASRVVVAIAFMMTVLRKYSSDSKTFDRFYDLSLLVLNHQVEPHVQTLGGWVSFFLLLYLINFLKDIFIVINLSEEEQQQTKPFVRAVTLIMFSLSIYGFCTLLNKCYYHYFLPNLINNNNKIT